MGLTYAASVLPKALLYEDAVRLPGVSEIDRGVLARISRGPEVGYFTRTQELCCGPHHVLALGFEGDGYLPPFEDARHAVEAIHRRRGLAVLNHPYVAPNDGALIIRYRLVSAEGQPVLRELAAMVDEIEVFNAQCINPTLGLIVPNMNIANDRAAALASAIGLKGLVCTDSHYRLEQAKLCGVYVEEEGLCIERLRSDVQNGDFDNGCRRYVSRLSFLLGMY